MKQIVELCPSAKSPSSSPCGYTSVNTNIKHDSKHKISTSYVCDLTCVQFRTDSRSFTAPGSILKIPLTKSFVSNAPAATGTLFSPGFLMRVQGEKLLKVCVRIVIRVRIKVERTSWFIPITVSMRPLVG